MQLTKNKEIQIFKKENLELRTVNIDGEPWFVARDISEILGYSDVEAMTRRLDEDEKLILQIVGFNSPRGTSLISESGLFNAILGSNKPEAKQFKKWVTSEVLPSIRKTGKYEVDRLLPSYQIENPIKRAERWIEEIKSRVSIS